MWSWLGSCLWFWHHWFFCWGEETMKSFNRPFILLSESPTSIETKCCVLYFGNPKVFSLRIMFWYFQNKIHLSWFWLFASSGTKQLPTDRSVLPSKLGCPAAMLEAWRSGNLYRTWVFLANQCTARVSRFTPWGSKGAREVQSQGQFSKADFSFAVGAFSFLLVCNFVRQMEQFTMSLANLTGFWSYAECWGLGFLVLASQPEFWSSLCSLWRINWCCWIV